MKEVNKNFIYNIIYQIFIYIIPLITVPYVSRILGVDNIGIYSYTYTMVYYFMLTAMLGINNYGSRVIAKCKDNRKERSYKFCSIYLLQLLLSLIMLILYIAMIVKFFNKYKVISFIQTIYLISVIFDINWLYFGLEKFKITISRNVIIKICSLVFIFIFVKRESDLWLYTLIMSVSTLVSQLYLWIFVKKYVDIVKVHITDIFAHLKKCIVLFVPVISYSIYRVMDKTMLGSISGTTELGYYENAEKIINIPISMITALGTVTLPYMSKNDGDNDKEFKNKMMNSFELCFCFIIPMMFGLFIVSNNFSNIFFGEEFYKSGNLIRLLCITILFSGIANVIRTNYLIPKELDSVYVKSTIVGAILNLIFNITFIPKFKSYGACYGTIIAEFSVMFYQIIYVRKFLDLKKVFILLCKYLVKGIIMSIPVILVGLVVDNNILKLMLQVGIGVITYFAINYKYILFDFLGKKKKENIYN